jgi:AcrR family transcriptional regulator
MPSAKDRILTTALQLFSRHGFHAVGVDRIVAESGVAKMTLYKHFRSKEQLIVQALQLGREQWMDWFLGRVGSAGMDPRERVLATFDALAAWFASPAFYGCPFVHAAAEFPRLGDPAHQVAADQKRAVFEWVRAQLLQLGVADVDTMARQLTLLIEGATVIAHVTGDGTDATRAARAAAEALLQC